MATRKTKEQFIKQAVAVHGNKYDYSSVEYERSHTKIIIICPEHGNFTQTPTNHIHTKTGCPMCGIIKQQQTNIERYGSMTPLLNKEIQEKIKQTNLKRYGFEHPQQNKEIQEKIKQTNILRYDVEYPQQNKTVQEKTKQTNLKRYGFEHPFQNKEVQEKIKQTNLINLGVVNPRSSKKIQDNIKQTNIKNHNGMHNKQQHMINTLPLLENKEWMINEYITQHKSATQIAVRLALDITTICNHLRKHNIEIRQLEPSSHKSNIWIESIMEKEHIYIQYAGNAGEFKIPGTRNYHADGYCAETNTIYEFHGDYWHGNLEVYDVDFWNGVMKKTMGQRYRETIAREETIRALGYNLITMWEHDWDSNHKYLEKDKDITNAVI